MPVLATLLGTAPVRGNRLHGVYITRYLETEDSRLKPKKAIICLNFSGEPSGTRTGDLRLKEEAFKSRFIILTIAAVGNRGH
jgi:hypothetical protein